MIYIHSIYLYCIRMIRWYTLHDTHTLGTDEKYFLGTDDTHTLGNNVTHTLYLYCIRWYTLSYTLFRLHDTHETHISFPFLIFKGRTHGSITSGIETCTAIESVCAAAVIASRPAIRICFQSRFYCGSLLIARPSHEFFTSFSFCCNPRNTIFHQSKCFSHTFFLPVLVFFPSVADL